ncbi:MAG: metal-dependent transcriptional regulator [Erysipelotrichaceae bacterium]
MKLGESLEDYLEALLLLENNGSIKSIEVAKMLEVSRPSVNKAMSVLKEYGFITQETYGDIYLTKQGRSKAESVLNRHLKIRNFLIDVLEVNEIVAEIDACKIEHIISDETFNKLTSFTINYKKR